MTRTFSKIYVGFHFKYILKPVPLLEISIDGCRIWPLVGKIRPKSLNVIPGLKIYGCTRYPKLMGAAAPFAPVLTMALQTLFKIFPTSKRINIIQIIKDINLPSLSNSPNMLWWVEVEPFL